MARSQSLIHRLEDKYIPEPNCGCWLWIGALIGNGYGVIKIDGVTQLAHRVSYELFVGPIPEGLILDHKCRIRCCINYEHTEPVTHQVNALRAMDKHFNSLKTHCPQGHPYDELNTWMHRNGSRICLACKQERERRSSS